MDFYNIKGVPVWLRNRGDQDVAGEIIEQDFYKLQELKDSGFEPKVVVDIGAHVGTFASFVHTLWPEAKIICFEPVPDNFDILERNAGFAELYNYAVRYDSATTFVTTKDATGGGFVTTPDNVENLSGLKHKWDGFNYEPLGSVETVSLEEILESEGVTHIDLLKLDCELSEFDIVKGIHYTTANNTRLVVGEYHSENGFSEFKALAEEKFPHLEFYTNGAWRDPIGGFWSKPKENPIILT